MRIVLLAGALAAVAPTALAAQASLATRVVQVRDGVVHVEFAGRPGVCGDGRTLVRYRSATFARDFTSFGGWTDQRCTPGPLRVSLTVANGDVTEVQTQVGGAWPTASAPVRDLGVVSPREASAYFFSLVPRLESVSGKDRLLLPAVLADDVAIVPPLLALARNSARTESTRRQAIQWVGLLGDASVVPVLVDFANDGSDDESADKPGKKGLASSAVAALSYLEEGAGIPALLQLARSAPLGTRRNAVFWVGQSGDPRGLKLLHTVIEDTREDDRVRKHAFFSLGSNDATPTADLVALYGVITGNSLREHAIFVISQREDDAAVDALMRIARSDADTRLRGKALFWLAQKKDPRVTKFISDIVLK